MKNWKLSEAKARFSEVVAKSSRNPQILVNRDKPVAAIVSMRTFKQLEAVQAEKRKSTVSELLEEIREINTQEADLEIPERTDRSLPNLD